MNGKERSAGELRQEGREGRGKKPRSLLLGGNW